MLKYQGQPTAIDLNNPTSLQMHLETRQDFQLENAISMELWQVSDQQVHLPYIKDLILLVVSYVLYYRLPANEMNY